MRIFFERIKDALNAGDKVEIRGFGSFTLKNYKGYSGRNPKTGEEVAVSPRRVVTYKASQKVKAKIASNNVSKYSSGEAASQS